MSAVETRHARSPLGRFVALHAAAYAAYGVASPFFPAFLELRGLAASQLGMWLAAGTAARLMLAPLASRLGDVHRAHRRILVTSAAMAVITTLGFWPARGVWSLGVLVLLQSATLAPITVLADALAIAHAQPARGDHGFEYGWVRGAGSAAFVVGMLLSGQAIGIFGLGVVIQLKAALLVVVAICGVRVPDTPTDENVVLHPKPHVDGFALLRSAPFRNLLLVSALVLGSHAMHDAFAVIRWTAAGVTARTASVLWSESVVAEVVVFLVVGPAILGRVAPAGAIALAAAAGAVRWLVLAFTARPALLALVEPLHGLTFALFHLAAVRVVTCSVPRASQATGLALYGTLGIGVATALLTLVSGGLYARFGALGFCVMAVLSAVALPMTLTLRQRHLRAAGETSPRRGDPP